MRTDWREFQFSFVMATGFLLHTILVLVEAKTVIFCGEEVLSEKVTSFLIVVALLSLYHFNRREFFTMIRDDRINNFHYSVTMVVWMLFNTGALYVFTLQRLNIPVKDMLELYAGG